ncbi:penicillin-binding protein [Streptomyces filipinensis]|uniref:Penicillin-binding protein n=1 Tax=Streptomyces filipinensis TaxID=66887 RepID=A0A918IG87_9ACTN|nr:penicillin-binding transpeptidase domain-containing protein [Streptomyces filipinensis]GGV11033.1 penicillin-binding protein [Streptomyces filipinensis]
MHTKIGKPVLAAGLGVALAVSATACGGHEQRGGPAGKSGAGAASRLSSSRGLGNIVVGGRPVTGSEPSGIAKVPYRRTYTDGALYAPVTGYRSMAFYRSGLEAVYDDVLSAGLKSGGPSGDVVTTIRPGVQKAAFDALGDREGAAVALDTRTGKLLALVSTPSYDPGTFSGNTLRDETAWKTLIRQKPAPLLNRALRLTAAPGAAFHVVVAAAALERGLYPGVDDATKSPLTFAVPGTADTVTGDDPRCENATIRTALRYSCANVFARMSLDVGRSALRSTAEKLGFNDEKLLTPLRAAESTYPTQALSGAQLARTGDGGGGVAATPVEMARITASLADGGRLVTPRLVDRVEKADGGTERPGASGDRSGQAVSRHTAQALRSVLTATAVRGGDVAGSWFTTCARQADGGTVSIAVYVGRSGGDGARRAEQVAGRIAGALS